METNCINEYYVGNPASKPRFPRANAKQLWVLLGALQRGERLTLATALERYNVGALSQRLGQLRALGWPIKHDQIPNSTNSGYHYEYFL